jgi:arylsulfatase A-like enzyme/Tfp pilus assembly protein PilF
LRAAALPAAAALAAVLLASGPFACGSGGGKPSVILIIIDTLRADHLGFMGYRSAQTPVLDALAARGTVFIDAESTVPVTLPSISTILTGRIPPHHGVRDNERFVLPDSELTLTERFQAGGWRTGAVVGSAVLSADRGLPQGFEVYDDAFTGPYPVYLETKKLFAESFAKDRRRADTVTDKAIALIDGFGGDPYFMLVHYFDVHAFYDPPPPYSSLHPGRPYDGEISFVDAEIGRLLERAGDKAVVVVVADHGEGMGEHGEMEHGFLLYQSTLHVPFVAAGPGIPRGLSRTDPVSLVDVAPTLTRWLDLPGSGPPFDGRSLVWDTPESQPASLYAETFHTVVSYHWSELRALREGPMKFITGAGRDELYNLAADPRELNGLNDPKTASRLDTRLTDMTGGETRDDVVAAMREDVDPERKEVLESLGYIGDVSTTPKEDNREYPHPLDTLPAWVQRQKTKSMYNFALTLATHDQFTRALAAFDSVVARGYGKGMPDVYYNRGVTRWKLQDPAGAREDLQAALGEDTDYVPALALIAELDKVEGKPQKAFALYQRVHALEPENLVALRFLSDWYVQRNELETALPHLRAWVNAAPQDPNARYNLGVAAYKTKRNDEAREHLLKFLQLAPGDERATVARETVDYLAKEGSGD